MSIIWSTPISADGIIPPDSRLSSSEESDYYSDDSSDYVVYYSEDERNDESSDEQSDYQSSESEEIVAFSEPVGRIALGDLDAGDVVAAHRGAFGKLAEESVAPGGI